MSKLKFIELNNKKIAYLDWNESSKDVVVCIHGINRNKHDFDYLANYLSDNGFRIIALDVPGRGESDYLDHYSEYSYENYVKILTDFISGLKLEKFSLVGTSMGGVISIILCSRMPERIKALVINDIGPYTDSVTLKILAKYVCNYPVFKDMEEASNYIKIFLRPLNIRSEEHWKHMIEHSIRRTKENTYILDFDPQILINFKNNAGKDRDLWEMWHQIDKKVSILILRGEKSNMLSKDTALKMLEGRGNIKLIEYENVGHTPSLLEVRQCKDVGDWLILAQLSACHAITI